ncbi:MAG: MBL fold metallo-hydrolase [Bacteroidia bacterium]|nr:MBL fold metallo-hydrolase [Bacteroidia bacterium]NNC85174.1 MBL fold metallo-hydrolase [Bacteroidia bacterium]NNM16894.1 MBL fold metallo-hydrolase [Bacteroidia bacterium]
MTLGSIIVILLLSGFWFITFSEQFGGTASEMRAKEYKSSPQYVNGKFQNSGAFNMEMDCHSIKKMMREMFNPHPNLSPSQNISVIKIDSMELATFPDTLTRVTWFGHSTILLEIDGKRILFDPVFGQYASPHPWLGRQRYNEEMPINIESLPFIDAVIISHDHYDHLDYESIAKLKSITKQFYVPLAVGNHLASWGISWDNIHEMDWWDENTLDELQIICAPSKHMSGRGMNDQFATLWGSWIIKGSEHSVYFSGDGGYGDRFNKIGEKYGPFDIGLLECGQYNELWADVHMTPEETVQAGRDIGAELILPIHWGSFSLATHSWTDPIDRVTANANEMGVPISTPQIGESIILGNADFAKTEWWKQYN